MTAAGPLFRGGKLGEGRAMPYRTQPDNLLLHKLLVDDAAEGVALHPFDGRGQVAEVPRPDGFGRHGEVQIAFPRFGQEVRLEAFQPRVAVKFVVDVRLDVLQAFPEWGKPEMPHVDA